MFSVLIQFLKTQSPDRSENTRGNGPRNVHRYVYRIEIIFVFVFGMLIAAYPVKQLRAHHPSGNTRGVDFGKAGNRPANQAYLDIGHLKATNRNRHATTATAALELAFLDNRVGLNLQMPYTYYTQKERRDAGRYGRPRLGGRWHLPFDLHPAFYSVLDADVGFPTGADRKRFVDENFYDSTAGITLGWSGDLWVLMLRGGGVFPVSRLPQASTYNAYERWPWEPVEETVTRDTHELKKVTEWRARMGLRLSEMLVWFAGFYYRVPYSGVVYEKASAGEIPVIYREVETGLSFQPVQTLAITLTYRYPLFRKSRHAEQNQNIYILLGRTPPNPAEYRLFDEGYSLTLSYNF
ncbi:MAG: hypothetical protein KDK34_15960 [Leptospiraceae bacterium]|nr:hypothetical protein [Leptospiraceae bacterium]MCB1321752.1 hypothetical protein [Leptospiraceae bacterium]